MNIDSLIFRLLGIRDYFSEEISQKLLQKGFSKQDVDSALERFKQKGYINDINLAERFIERQKRLGFGCDIIRNKLFHKSKDQKLVSLVKEDRNDQKQAIQKLIEKRSRSLDLADFKERQKLFSYLARRGFPVSAILEAFHERGADKDLQ